MAKFYGLVAQGSRYILLQLQWDNDEQQYDQSNQDDSWLAAAQHALSPGHNKRHAEAGVRCGKNVSVQSSRVNPCHVAATTAPSLPERDADADLR